MPLADVSPVDGYLAATFALDPDDLWAPGVHVTAHVAPWLVGWRGVVAFARGRRTLVSVPPELVLVSEGLRRLTPGGEGDHLAEPLREVFGAEVFGAEVFGAEVFGAEVFGAEVFGGRVFGAEVDGGDDHGDGVAVLGPSRWGFADSVLDLESHPPAEVAIVDADELEPLAGVVGAEEWSEGGFDRSPALLLAVRDDGGEIAAAANLTCWRAAADDVGVCVHPDRRGQGFGRVAAHAGLSAAIGDHGIGRYRALLTNAGSLRIADRIGVVGYGMQYAVVPPGADGARSGA